MTQTLTPGLTGGVPNEELFSKGRLRDIDWITLEEDPGEPDTIIIRLVPLARRPINPVANPPEKFPPVFLPEEILEIAKKQIPDAQTFQNKKVYVDGILPATIGLRLGSVCERAREVHMNIPNLARWQKVWERDPYQIRELRIGDRIHCYVFGHEVSAEVISLSETQVYVRELSSRRGQRIWVSAGDLRGWE